MLLLALLLLLLLLQGTMRCCFCKAAGGCCTVRSLQQAALGGSMPHAGALRPSCAFCTLAPSLQSCHQHAVPAGIAQRYATWECVCTVQAANKAHTELS
jgi:hypothetical protein